MANAWTELSRSQRRNRSGSLIAACCLALLGFGCSEPPTIDQAANSKVIKSAAGASPDGVRFMGKVGRFNPAGDKLAVIEGQELVLMSLLDGQRSVTAIDQAVTDLAYADDDSLWLIGRDAASYWKNGGLECTTEKLGDSLSLLEITEERLDLVSEMYVDGGGVFGERIRIGTDCGVEHGAKEQAIETAISSLSDGRQVVARAAAIDAGPVRRQGPVIEYRDGEKVLSELPVFKEQADISSITAIASGDDRVLALGTGASASHWELWTIDNPRLIDRGQLAEPSDRMLSFAGIDRVVVGQELIDLASGQGQPLIGSGVIQDVTDDQAWWLIAEGEHLSLRSAQNLGKP